MKTGNTIVYKRTLEFDDTDKPMVMVVDEYIKTTNHTSFSSCVMIGLQLFIEQKSKDAPVSINKCLNRVLKKLGVDKVVDRIESKETI